MSEKRRPEIKVVAEIHGKRFRCELYPSNLWPGKFPRIDRSRGQSKRYRVRINGKWAQGDTSFTVSQFTNDLRKLLSRPPKVSKTSSGDRAPDATTGG